LAVTVAGLPYYAAPLAERLWSPYHDWLKPSGYVGQSAGFLAFALFLALWLYPLRKKLRFLSFAGSLGRWLDVHIVFGLLAPLLGAVHSAWRFDGLIGLGYLSMLIVAISGIIGRYLYVRIPRRRNGLELSREDVASARRDLVGRIVESTGFAPAQIEDLLRPAPVPTAGEGLLRSAARMVQDDLGRRRAIRRLLAEYRKARPAGAPMRRSTLRRIARLARREMALSQQIRMLDVTNRVFRLWHVAHRPFAIVALGAVGVHVAVVVALGATWIR
jgi:hypothetical protein